MPLEVILHGGYSTRWTEVVDVEHSLSYGLGVTQGHWKYHQPIERIRLPIDVL